MRKVALCLMWSTWVAWMGGCAETDVCPPGERSVSGVCAAEPRTCDEPISRSIPLGCMVSPEEFWPNVIGLEWELTVEAPSIVSGEAFAPVVTGRIVIAPQGLNEAFGFGLVFTRAEIPKAEGRISVRGASVAVGGNPVVLEADIPKTCTYDRNGDRGFGAGPFPPCSEDTDCVDPPSGPPNRCASFLDFEVSNDCDLCAELGYSEVCTNQGLCVVGAAEFALGPNTGTYVAEGPGSAFFGWAEDVDLIEFGADRGAFDLTEHRRTKPEDAIKFTGFNALLGPAETTIEILLECAMGVTSRGPDGPPTAHVLTSPAPSSMLIACPIE